MLVIRFNFQVSDFPANTGSPILYGDTQLAVFNNVKRGEWYCTQNMCPHKQAFVLSQGIIGDAAGVSKVACPLHKKQFALEDGQELGGDLRILTFPVKVTNDEVFVELPSVPEIDAILGTHGLRVERSDCVDIAGDALKVPVKKSFDKVMQAGQQLVGSLRKETALRAESGNSTSVES